MRRAEAGGSHWMMGCSLVTEGGLPGSPCVGFFPKAGKRLAGGADDHRGVWHGAAWGNWHAGRLQQIFAAQTVTGGRRQQCHLTSLTGSQHRGRTFILQREPGAGGGEVATVSVTKPELRLFLERWTPHFAPPSPVCQGVTVRAPTSESPSTCPCFPLGLDTDDKHR